MPKYTFFCKDCQLEIERRLSMGSHPTHKCPSCRKQAPRHFDGQGFGFGFTRTEGSKNANSGVAKHDYPTADEAVGSSAEERWKVMDARNKVKAKLRSDSEAVSLARKDVRVGGAMVSDYTAMGKGQFDARKQMEGKFKAVANENGITTEKIPEKPQAQAR